MSGKVVIQTGSGELRRIPVTSVRPRSEDVFLLDKFSVNEDSLHIWTSLFFLSAQDFKIDKEKWKLLSGSLLLVNSINTHL